MKTKSFAAIQEQLPVIGLGCWAMGTESGWHGAEDAESIRTIERAVDLGVTFLDTAPVYGRGASEMIVGKALRGKRDNVFLATKCGLVWNGTGPIGNDLSKQSVQREIEASLRRLDTDRIDLYQLHWPDPKTPLEETAEALIEAREAGKIRYIGVSNFSPARMKEAHRLFGVASFQGLYNLLERNPDSYHGIPLEYRAEREILPLCAELGIPYLPYSPLMQGLLTDGFEKIATLGNDDVRAANPKLNGENRNLFLDIARDLASYAKGIGRPLEHLAIAWLIHRQSVGPVICGAKKTSQIERNAAASESSVDDAIIREVDRILGPWMGSAGPVR